MILFSSITLDMPSSRFIEFSLVSSTPCQFLLNAVTLSISRNDHHRVPLPMGIMINENHFRYHKECHSPMRFSSQVEISGLFWIL